MGVRGLGYVAFLTGLISLGIITWFILKRTSKVGPVCVCVCVLCRVDESCARCKN